jgi:hypothetical protein
LVIRSDESQNVIATRGGINNQIANHLEIMHLSNPDIAKVLEEFVTAVQQANLQLEQREQLLLRLDTLANEISSKPSKSQNWSILDRTNELVKYVVTIVSSNAGAYELIAYCDKLMPLIRAAFGG